VKRRPTWRSTLEAMLVGPAIGLVIGGAIGYVRYEPDPNCWVMCGPSLDVAAGAFSGALLGAIAGLLLGALPLARRFSITRST
jgi:hypothetical protein